ncbi:hypothetical protein L1887_39893 [Cichorium endivia]|nr:hypothetical protein L1887_39893 [Cichorium endivia]
MEMKCSPFVDTQPRPPLERVDPPLSSFSRSFPFFSLYKIHTYIRTPSNNQTNPFFYVGSQFWVSENSGQFQNPLPFS